MKIDINKDFEKAFPDDLWKGFTLKQIITFAIGIIMAAGTIAALWKFMKISPITGSYCIPNKSLENWVDFKELWYKTFDMEICPYKILHSKGVKRL